MESRADHSQKKEKKLLSFDFDWDEVTALIAILRAKGLKYLVATDELSTIDEESIDANSLVQRIAGCNYPLVENASIALFILHPELATAVVTAMQESVSEISENIAIVTLATLYLQQWWVYRLAFALGHISSFPDEPFRSLWEQRSLPKPGSDYGLKSLLALQDYQQRRYGAQLNFLDDWQNQIDHLLAQEESQQRQVPDEVLQVLRGLSMEEG